MPRKINVVSLSDIKPTESEDDVSVVNNDEVTQIKETARPVSSYANMAEAIKEEETLNKTIEAPKPKPKRKPPVKKPKVVEETVAVVEPIPEPTPEPVVEQLPKGVLEPSSKVEQPSDPQKKVKTLELVECPSCHKQMTKRTLRYDHHKICPGEKVDREQIPVQRRIKKEVVETKQPPAPMRIPEDIIEQEVKKRIQSSIQDRMQQRLKLKEERIKKLASQIA